VTRDIEQIDSGSLVVFFRIQKMQQKTRQMFFATTTCSLLSLASFFWLDGQSLLTGFFKSLPGDGRELLENLAIFGHGTGVMIAFLLVLSLDRQDRRNQILVVISPLIAGVIATALKIAVLRPRPTTQALALASPESFGDAVLTNSFQSFPSGHTATAVALALVLAHRYPKGRALFFFLALVTAIERVMTQAHFLSDVFAGASAGMIGMMVAEALVSRRPQSLLATDLLASRIPGPVPTVR
jgi:membrane-associated phospholipid phosphatase